MKNFKILISPSKTFNESLTATLKPINVLFSEEAEDVFKTISVFNQTKIEDSYGVSSKIAKKVIEYNKVWGKETYKAIDLFSGMVFKELKINDKNMKWVNDHILILDALYGIVRPNDYISKYRLDFKTKININLRDIWTKKINNYLKDFKIYSLASKEFTNLLIIDFIEIKVDKTIKQIKKARGVKLNQLISEMNDKL